MLVIETNGYSGGFTLGFRIDPKDKLQLVTNELSSLFRIHAQTPEFGVHFTTEQVIFEINIKISKICFKTYIKYTKMFRKKIRNPSFQHLFPMTMMNLKMNTK